MLPKTKKWIQDLLSQEILSIEKLDGGASSKMYSVQLTNHRPVVVRQLTDSVWLEEEKDVLLQEKHQLNLMENTPVPTPQFIGVDPYAEKCEYPTFIMSKLPGDMQSIIGISNGIHKLAEVVQLIHQTPIDQQHRKYMYAPYESVKRLSVPHWTNDQQTWQRLIDYMHLVSRPSFEQTLIHRDFHLNNILWEQDEISGVVDWINSCVGPKYIDVAHCRWNLAMTFSTEVADAFLQAYERLNMSDETYDVYWDILSLFDIFPNEITVYSGWELLGVQKLSQAMLYDRLNLYAKSLYKRI